MSAAVDVAGLLERAADACAEVGRTDMIEYEPGRMLASAFSKACDRDADALRALAAAVRGVTEADAVTVRDTLWNAGHKELAGRVWSAYRALAGGAA